MCLDSQRSRFTFIYRWRTRPWLFASWIHNYQCNHCAWPL